MLEIFTRVLYLRKSVTFVIICLPASTNQDGRRVCYYRVQQKKGCSPLGTNTLFQLEPRSLFHEYHLLH